MTFVYRYDGTTALITAVAMDNIAIVTSLLDKGCSVDLVPSLQTRNNELGESAIHLTARAGNAKMCELLIHYNADVNMTSFGGRTPVMKACFHGNYDVTKLLLSHGANIRQVDDQEMNCLHYACMNGSVDIIGLLLDMDKTILDVPNWRGETPLMLATEFGHWRAISCLLQNNCDINLTCQRHGSSHILSGHAALHISSRDDHVNISRDLIANGASINLTDGSDRTALHWACREGNLNIVRLLLACDMNIDLQNVHGETSLFEAVNGCHEDIVELLLKYNANPDILTNNGKSALTKAIHLDSVAIVKCLLLSNCNLNHHWINSINQKQTETLDPMGLALQNANLDIVRMLMTAGFNINSVMNWVFSYQTKIEDKTRNMTDSNTTDLPIDITEYLVLKHMCKVKIRNLLGICITQKVQALYLPSTLKQYVLLNDGLEMTKL